LTSIQGELRDQLVGLLGDRMATGEVLISPAHFLAAIAEDYQVLTGNLVSEEVKSGLSSLLGEANKSTPELLLIPGIENWITKSVYGLMRKKSWGVTEVHEGGNQLVRDFVKSAQVKALLQGLKITPNQLNVRRCLHTITYQIAGKEDPQQKRSLARLAQARANAKTAVPTNGGDAPIDRAAQSEARLQELLSGPAADPSAEEVEHRQAEQKKAQAKIRKEQMDHLIAHLDQYVAQGKMTEEEAGKLKKLHQVAAAVQSGKVDKEKGSKVRNSILSGTARYELDKKVKETIDYVVRYTQVYDALGRIEQKYDDALRLLIEYKEVANAAERTQEEFGALGKKLIEDTECLQKVIGLLDRQDGEVRMIAANLPPYSHIMRRDQDRISNMVIEESFVTQLRESEPGAISEKLRDPDRKVQVRVAADMLCMAGLINRLIKPTPLRKEIRLLKLNLIIEDFFRSSDSVDEARSRAQQFLESRILKLYPDLSEEETAEMQQLGAEMIESVEQTVVAERAAASAAAASGAASSSASPAGEGELSQEEAKNGVQIGRVLMRVGGGQRVVPFKIMPDEDDPSKFVLVKKDADSGELLPVRRRGAKRYVVKNREGVWEPI
jgi:hypothetical protein